VIILSCNNRINSTFSECLSVELIILNEICMRQVKLNFWYLLLYTFLTFSYQMYLFQKMLLNIKYELRSVL